MATAPWATDIVIDQSVLDAASATKGSTGARKLEKHEVVLALARVYGIGATREDARTGATEWLVRALTPLPNAKTTNERYNVLAKVVEQLPEDLWYGITTYVDGEEQVQVPAFQSLNILPYLEALENNPDAPDVNSDALKSAKESVSNHISAIVELNYSQQGITPDSPEVATARETAKASTVIPTVDATGGTEMQPAASGGFMVDPALMSEMSAQEFAQTYRDTTLVDLGFDKTLRFGLGGVLAGGNVGGDDGIDVYEASRWLYTLTPAQVGQLQVKLANAGYFDQVGQSYSQVNSADDAATRMAWDLFLVDVVRSGAEAKPQDVLNKRMAGYLSSRTPAEGMVFTDEATLQSLGNDFARALVGRNLDFNELQSFYKMARQWEREAALGVTFAQDNEQIDVRARAEEYFDSELRLERAKQLSYDWAEKFK